MTHPERTAEPSEATWPRVARALLGRWPSQVATWGEQGIAAFIEELQADGLSPERALIGIRMHRPKRDFPPSVAAVTALARKDPSSPTFEEFYRLTFGRGGILKARLAPGASFGSEAEMQAARNDAATRRARELHPLVATFVDRYGINRLRLLGVDDPDFGELRRKELREAWSRHCEAMSGRDVAALASGSRRGELGRFDPLGALGLGRAEIGPGTS